MTCPFDVAACYLASKWFISSGKISRRSLKFSFTNNNLDWNATLNAL